MSEKLADALKVRKDRSGAPDEDNWQTPQWLYDQLDAEFKFDFDPCPNFSTFDGLSPDTEWGNSNFINPPYNRMDKPKFIQRAYDEWRNGKTCVLLIPAATGTKQFHDLILPHAEVRFLKGRIAFVEGGKPRDSKATAKGKHDSMVVIFRGDKSLAAHEAAKDATGDEEPQCVKDANQELMFQLGDKITLKRETVKALSALRQGVTMPTYEEMYSSYCDEYGWERGEEDYGVIKRISALLDQNARGW